MKIAFVVIALGQRYLMYYNMRFRKSHVLYCKRHNYDFKVITDPFTPEGAHVDAYTFNKIMVCETPWAQDYETIIVVDADILINSTASAIHTFMGDSDRIGIVDENAQSPRNASQYYAECGLNVQTNHILNTGVIVFKPAIHGTVLGEIWRRWIGGAVGHTRGYHYEQSCIGYELIKRNLFQLLPRSFNAIWYYNRGQTLDTYFLENHFTHFAGGHDIKFVTQLHKYLDK
jgi:hypothetical protein